MPSTMLRAYREHVMRVAKEAADVRDRHAQRTGVTYGNMRAKLSDYIGQVFECKAARGKGREANGERHVKRKIVDGVFFLPPAPCPSPLALLGQSRRGTMNYADNGMPAQSCHPTSPALAFLDIAYPIT